MVNNSVVLQATKHSVSSWNAAVCFVFMARELTLFKAMELVLSQHWGEVTRQSPVFTSDSLTVP
jgi:hypothetical protein